MVDDEQLDIYNNIFVPSLKNITQMELTGMPMDMPTIKSVSTDLELIMDQSTNSLLKEELVADYLWLEQKKAFILKNTVLKKKFKPLDEFVSTLNTNSPLQLGQLLYGFLGLPIVDTTDTGQPATGKKTVKKLFNAIINEYDIQEDEL
jgi:DNA polymerase-1